MYKRFYIIFLIILAFCTYTGFAQTDKTQQKDSLIKAKTIIKNPEGREFWLCFMKNFKNEEGKVKKNELFLELFITGDKDANVTLEIKSLGYKEKVFVQAGTVLNKRLDPLAQITSYEIIEQTAALHITSDNPITVYGLNRRDQTTDTYLGLPVEVIGFEYRVMSYFRTDELLSEAAIVATENMTEVTITPTVETYLGYPANKPFKVSLNKGDVYQFAGRPDLFSRLKSDLTGTLISANKKIAVFGGHQCSYVPATAPAIIACNHLVEQMPPVKSWGKHFYIGNFLRRSKYTYRVLAHYPNTRVFEDSKLAAILEPGQFMERISNKNIQITADKPILVGQFSQGFRNGDSIGDPMMILISPTQQFLRKYRFATPINGQWEHVINIVAPTKSISALRLDGKPVDSTKFTKLGLSRYSEAGIRIQYGSHTIEGAMPFGMYSYGFGYGDNAFDAYGAMGGQSFVDYEPDKDTIPPLAEINKTDAKKNTNKLSVNMHDDGLEDSGIKMIRVLESINLDPILPKYEEGAPQIPVDFVAQKLDQGGKVVFEVTDMALNSSIYTICYVFDENEGTFKYLLNKGKDVKCAADPGYVIGAFGRIAYNLHTADFSQSGGIAANGKFSDASSMGGYFGFSVSRKINADWGWTGKLIFENIAGTISAPDSTRSRVRDQITGELKEFQESRELKLLGWRSTLGFYADYSLSRNIYWTGGVLASINLSKSIDFKRLIVNPNDFTYPDGTRITTPAGTPDKLTSLNTFNLGISTGVGINYPIIKRIDAFFETNYNYYLNNLISDGDWGLSQISIMFGVKYKL